jgi:hypothetical protein
MAVGEYPHRFRSSKLGSDLNEHHGHRKDGSRSRGLQKDAERTVIGVGAGVERMDMRHLDHD